MNDRDPLREGLSRLTPQRFEDTEPNWVSVVERATARRRWSRIGRAWRNHYRGAARWTELIGSSRRYRRGLAIGIAAIAALTGSAFAVSAANDWWFFFDGTPKPTSQVIVVRTGEWDGQEWILTAYRAESGICYSLTRGRDASGKAVGLACGPDEYPASTNGSPSFRPRISIALAQGSSNFPASIRGTVTDEAAKVRIALANGDAIETNTIEAIGLGARVRFFAAPLPCETAPVRVVGFNKENEVVAEKAVSGRIPPYRGSICS